MRLDDGKLRAVLARGDAGELELDHAGRGFEKRRFGAEAAFEQLGMVGLLDERRGRRGPIKLRPEIVDFIRAGTGSGAQIAEQVADRFGVVLHRRTVERVRGR